VIKVIFMWGSFVDFHRIKAIKIQRCKREVTMYQNWQIRMYQF
jgi:hypothetical protein